MAAAPRWERTALLRNASDREAFRAYILELARPLYRDMPWRNIDDTYGVLVSEVMLQQTQVSRVLTRWPAFIRRFPCADALAQAGTGDVLSAWQGMGYNRRALNLKRACETVSANFAGRFPETVAELVQLPGIGPATAAGVVAFACNKPAMYLETNVRTVLIHELFADAPQVSDAELHPLVSALCPATDVRLWYYALLDYGAWLKATLGREADPARRSTSYTRQSAFEGSHRQKRARLLRIVLAAGDISYEEAASRLDEQERQDGRPGVDAVEFSQLVRELSGEGFFHSDGDTLRC